MRIEVMSVLLVVLVIAVGTAAAQEPADPYYGTESEWDEATRGPLPRWRAGGTPEPDPDRPLTPYSVGLSAYSSAPTSGLITSPPEYAPSDGVLFRYSANSWADVVTDLVASLTGDPSTDEIAYVVVADSANQSFAKQQFLAAGGDIHRIEFIYMPNDSIWLRDYGPHFVWHNGAKAIVDSHYYPGRPLDNYIPSLLADDYFVMPSYDIPLYYSGGNFQPSADRQGFTTSLVHQDNPGFGESFISELYNTYQGIDTLHIFPRLPSSVDGTGHIDMWFYLVDEDTVIISEFLPGSDPDAITITNNAADYMRNTLGYEVFRVPDHNGFHPNDPQAHFTYTNAFRVNDRIFIPTYGEGDSSHLARDAEALASWQAAAGPGVEIVPINSYDIIWAAGAIHCIVMQVPRYTDPVPSAVVVAPDGGELLAAGSAAEVLWGATDDAGVDAVDLFYSTDGGVTFDGTIALAETDDGRHVWPVPLVEAPDARVKVVARDAAANTAEATSATSFELVGALQRVYDFTTGGGVDRWGWGASAPGWGSVDGLRLPVSTEITTSDAEAYDKIAVSDATGDDTDPARYASPLPGSGNESTHVYEFTIEEDPAVIADIGVVWEGYGDACLQMELYVWDYTTGQWCDGRGQCGENRFMDNHAGNRDESLRGHIREDFERYLGPDGRLTVLLYAERSGQESLHDYVAVTVTTDNCAGVENFDQANSDGDLAGDACDCAPLDDTLFELPFEIGNVRMAGNRVTVQWDADGSNGGGSTYDVLRGRIDELPVGSGGSESCLVTSWAGVSFDDTEGPPENTGFYYLVRGGNGCGSGSYGVDSNGAERAANSCP
jgi:agmatine/peptidylarginine deiminase